MNRGGKRDGSGNKPGIPLKDDKERRTIRKVYRFSLEERKLIEQAVTLSGIEESKFVRSAILEKVEGILKQEQE